LAALPGAGAGPAVRTAGDRAGLLGGSAVLLVTLNLANALHFGFHIAMARLLGPAGYGALSALLAILYVLNVFAESVQTVLARYASREDAPGRLHDLLRRGLRRGGRATLAMAVAYLAAAVPLGRWLRIPFGLMALFGVSLVGVGLLPVLRGVLQGRKRFGALGMSMIWEVLAKLVIGVGLVWAGAGEYGAVAGVSLGFAFAFALAFAPLRDLFHAERERAEAVDIYRYSLPVFVVTATVMGFYSLDVLLARAFFPDVVAGGYAVASFLGKAILLGTAPVTKAAFPHSATGDSTARRKVLLGTLGLLALCVAPVVAAFATIPELLVRGMGGKGYAEAAALVPPLGIAMALMAFSNALLLYRLSLGHVRFYALLPALIPLEAAVLALFRDSPLEFAWAVAAMNAVFLLVSGLVAALSSPRRYSPAPSAPPPASA
jgi:O-antigen/teichoic acid export membrane protein